MKLIARMTLVLAFAGALFIGLSPMSSEASAGTPRTCKAIAAKLSAQHGVGHFTGRRALRSSDHNRNMAWDFPVRGKKGDALAAQARRTPGVKYVLWRVKAHHDHVHVSCK